MGLLGRITGWDQQKDAHNAILANHFVETATAETKRCIALTLVSIHHKANFYKNQPDRKILAIVSALSRIKQMNFVAIACMEAGIPSNIAGVQFAHVSNPHRSESDSSLSRVGVTLADLSRRAGQQLSWPGNDAKIDFVSWAESRIAAIAEVSARNTGVSQVNPEYAAHLAFRSLLSETIDFEVVLMVAREVAEEIDAQSDKELALATSLFFFEDEKLLTLMFPVQLAARMLMAQWFQEGAITPGAARYFESQLYTLYKP